jgi:hypothetical protein
MLKHEAKLIDPDESVIVAALKETVVAANKRCRARLLEADPVKWRKFLRDCAATAEGYAMFRGGRGGVPATQVLAAWWTDAAGRKHVVLRGRRVEHDEAKRLLHKDDLDARPALWHAYPEYVCRRTAGDEAQIVCACGCGAVGTPESLGWMGETCGPCFDRKEEVGAGALRTNAPGALYGHRDPLGSVACSPDGGRVAAIEGADCVTCWDIAARTRTQIHFPDRQVRAVAITSDARRLLVTGLWLGGVGGLFATFDLTDPPTPHPAREVEPGGWQVTALPDPTTAVVGRCVTNGPAFRLTVVRVPGGDELRSTPTSTGLMSWYVLSPDAKLLAAIDLDALIVLRVSDLQPAFTIPVNHSGTPLFHITFSHDSKRLFVAGTDLVRAQDLQSGDVVASGRLPRPTRGVIADRITALTADPAGAWVYAGSAQGTVYAFAASDLAPRAAFEWHLGEVTGLATSADGTRLFSSSADGCAKVWPIRELMRGI